VLPSTLLSVLVRPSLTTSQPYACAVVCSAYTVVLNICIVGSILRIWFLCETERCLNADRAVSRDVLTTACGPEIYKNGAFSIRHW